MFWYTYGSMNVNYIKTAVTVGLVIAIVALVIYYGISFRNIFDKPGITIDTSSTAVIKELRSLNRLETASFTIEKIIEAGTTPENVFQDILYSDRILLIAHGEVIAGIDLSKIQDGDVQINGSSLTLRLPAPQILSTTLSNEKTRVYDRDTGFLSRGDKDLETEARKAAEQSIKTAACEGKILEEASNNAKGQLTTLFKTLGYTTVTIDIPSGSCK